MKILAGSSNIKLAEKIAEQLDLELVKRDVSKFANGETRVTIKEDLSGQNVSLVQSFSKPVDEHIIETLLLIDALERAAVRNINLIIPWMGYSLQDKVFYEGEALAAKVVAKLFSHTQLQRVILFDLHNNSIQGFFNTPVNSLSAVSLFADYAKKNFDLKNAVVVSPDFGALKSSRVFADELGLDLVNIDKSRDINNIPSIQKISGSVKDKVCLLFDDVINTGGTVLKVAKFLKKEGAKEVHFLVTHGLFAGEALKKMTDESIDSIVISNSIAQDKLPAKIKILDASPIFAGSLKSWL